MAQASYTVTKATLQRHWDYLIDTLQLSEIAEAMIRNRCLTYEQYRDLAARNMRETQRMTEFLYIVFNKMRFPGTQFCIALERSGYSQVVDVLKSGVPEPFQRNRRETPIGAVSSITEHNTSDDEDTDYSDDEDTDYSDDEDTDYSDHSPAEIGASGPASPDEPTNTRTVVVSTYEETERDTSNEPINRHQSPGQTNQGDILEMMRGLFREQTMVLEEKINEQSKEHKEELRHQLDEQSTKHKTELNKHKEELRQQLDEQSTVFSRELNTMKTDLTEKLEVAKREAHSLRRYVASLEETVNQKTMSHDEVMSELETKEDECKKLQQQVNILQKHVRQIGKRKRTCLTYLGLQRTVIANTKDETECLKKLLNKQSEDHREELSQQFDELSMKHAEELRQQKEEYAKQMDKQSTENEETLRQLCMEIINIGKAIMRLKEQL